MRLTIDKLGSDMDATARELKAIRKSLLNLERRVKRWKIEPPIKVRKVKS